PCANFHRARPRQKWRGPSTGSCASELGVSMYAVIRTGGKQYRVKEGDVLSVERLPGDEGSKITFEQVLAVGEGANLKVGAPTVSGAKVDAEIVLQGRARKVIVFKFKRRKNYKRTKGHRQYFTRIKVNGISA